MVGMNRTFNMVATVGTPAAGTIDITVGTRSTLMCAPDSIRFTPDLTSFSVAPSAAAPTGGEIYDARLHDIVYLWDFGDSDDTWSAPVNTLDFWKNRNFAAGPIVGHVYRAAGDYTVTLTAMELSSGKTWIGATSVSIVTADSKYPTVDTICVNKVGDADFTGAPTGASTVNIDTLDSSTGTWWSDHDEAGVPKRWLFKRGSEWTDMDIDFDSTVHHGLMLGAYGSGVDPIINVRNTGTGPHRGFRCLNHFTSTEVTPDIRIDQLRILGNFDPTTENTVTSSADTNAGNGLFMLDVANICISQCEFTGFRNTAIYIDPHLVAYASNMHIDDTIMTDSGGSYPIYQAPNVNDDTSYMITGSRIAQNPNACADTQMKACARINDAHQVYIGSTDFFLTDYSQPSIKGLEQPNGDDNLINICGNTFEGGSQGIVLGQSSSAGVNRSSVHNIVVDSNVLLGAYSTQSVVLTFVTGVTVRNNLYAQPDLVSKQINCTGIMDIDELAGYDATIVGAAPINCYNNTMHTDRTTGNGGTPQAEYRDQSNFTGQNFVNNIINAPSEASPQVLYAPLSSTALFTPRSIGYIDPTSFVLDGTLATPVGTMKTSVPTTGSDAIAGATTGDTAYHDGEGNERPDPPSVGVWEASSTPTVT